MNSTSMYNNTVQYTSTIYIHTVYVVLHESDKKVRQKTQNTEYFS